MTAGIQDLRTESDAAFLAKIRPDLEQLEQTRLEKLKNYLWRKRLAIPAAIVATPVCAWIDWMLLMWQRGNDDSGAGVTFAVLGGLYWWATVPRRQYARAYKTDILPQIAQFLGGLTYCVDGKIPMEDLRPSGIVPSHDNYKSEDCFEGAYKGVTMRFSEIKLTETQGSGKNRRTVTKFRGLCILLGLPRKKFFGHTIMMRDHGKLVEWFRDKTSDLDKANLVDPEFEKLFEVYTNDQVEARYLIDPAMIERLKALYAEYDGEKMSVAYFNSHMLVMVASRHNHFEPAGLETPATDPVSINTMRREIGEILSVIDRLELYDPAKIHGQAA